MALSNLGQLIFLDRYAVKDHDRSHLVPGQRVVVCPDTKVTRRFLARLEGVDAEEQQALVTLEQSEESLVLPWDQVDLPVEDFIQGCGRVAGAVAAPEDESTKWATQYGALLSAQQFVPAGRIWAGAGVQEFLTAFNCFVTPPPKDSRSGIIETLNQLTEIMSRGGGVGVPLMSLRPKYFHVKGVNGRSSGSVCWSELYAFATKLIEQGGCLSELCNVLTDRGFVSAGDLYSRAKKETFRVWTHEGWKGLTNRWDKGVQEIYRVKTKRGYEIELTRDHKVLRLNSACGLDLVPLEEVREGDTLAILPGSRSSKLGSLSLDTSVPKRSKHSSRSKSYDLPAVLDDRLAWLVGYFTANGSVRSKSRGGDGIRFTVPDAFPKDLQRVRSLLKEVFGYEANPLEGSGACQVLEVSSVQIEDFLRQNGLLKERSSEAFVPELVKQSGMSQVEHFVAGCFAGDGCFSGEQPFYSTSCHEFARELQDLLLSVGVPSSLDGRSNDNGDSWWILSFPGKRAQERLVEIMDGRAQRVEGFECATMERSWAWPANLAKSGIPSSSYRNILNPSAARTSVRAVGRVLENLGGAASDELRLLAECFPVEVESIQRIGEARTYDFEVEGTHKLWVDGFYVSNSRQGALMLMHYDWHPDIIDFINAKRDSRRLTGANLSVAVSDELMEAVDRNEDWNLRFPDTDHPAYDAEWDGDICVWEGKGYPVKVTHTLPARDLWWHIVKAAHASAEPGLWFVGRYNKMSNSYYYPSGRIYCTNPCAEQGIPAWSVCNLGHANLSQHLKGNGLNGVPAEIDWVRLEKTVRSGVRFLDDVVDIAKVPFPQQREQQESERRVGLGTMGLGEVLIRCHIRYGANPECLRFIDNLYKFICLTAYDESIELAKEKGPFPLCDSEKLVESGFFKTLPDDIRAKAAKYGMRNVTVLTQAPTGTVGTMMDTSTGIEPYPWLEWEREGRLGRHKEMAAPLRDWLKADNSVEDLPDYFVSAADMTPEDHAETQAAIQRWVDSSISKTSNLPHDYTVDQVDQFYRKMYESGCKGGTVYRDLSRDKQVLHKAGSGKQEFPEVHPVPKDPYEMKAISIQTSVGKLSVKLGYDPETHEPFELWLDVSRSGTIMAADREAIARLISLLLRVDSHVTPSRRVQLVIDQLQGIQGGDPIGYGPNKVFSVPDAVAKALMLLQNGVNGSNGKCNGGPPSVPPPDICPECHGATLYRAGGCEECVCGFSKC